MDFREVLYKNHLAKKHFVYDKDLEKLAEKHIQELVSKKKVYHGNIPKNGYQNIASGKKNLLKDNVCFTLWYNDPPHRQAIDFTMKLGISYFIDGDNNTLIVCNYQ